MKPNFSYKDSTLTLYKMLTKSLDMSTKVVYRFISNSVIDGNLILNTTG